MTTEQIIKRVTEIAQENGLPTDERSLTTFALMYIFGQRDELQEQIAHNAAKVAEINQEVK